MKRPQTKLMPDWADTIESLDIESERAYGVAVDVAFLKLLDTIKEFEKDWGIKLDDYLANLYVDDGHVDEVTGMVIKALKNTATWRDIAEMLFTADENRSVFILSDNGHLYAVSDEDFYDLRNKIVDHLREYK